jgi:hypothetical protein
MTKLRVATLALATVGMAGVGVAAGGRDDPARKGDGPPTAPARNGDGVVEFEKDGAVHRYRSSQYTTVNKMERVEAYRIGDDLFVNVAPPGSGRVLLEKISAGLATQPQAKAAPKPDAPPKSRGEAIRSVKDITDGFPDIFVAAPGQKPTDGTPASQLYRNLIDNPAPPGNAQSLRRIYLDILGRVPTTEEVKAFVDSDAPDKAEQLVSRLIDDPAAIEHLKESLRPRIQAQIAQMRKTTAKPVTFTITGATLDRVDIEHGNLVDLRLDNGHDRPREQAGAMEGWRDYVVMPPATRLIAVPVGVDAQITVVNGEKITASGKGEAGLKLLMPGMTLDLKVSAEGGYMLIITEIKAHPNAADIVDDAVLKKYYRDMDLFTAPQPARKFTAPQPARK